MPMQLLVSLFFIAVLLVLTLIVAEAAWQNRRLVFIAQDVSRKVEAVTASQPAKVALLEPARPEVDPRVAAIEEARRTRPTTTRPNDRAPVTNLGPITIEADGSLAIPPFDLTFEGFDFVPAPPPPASPAVPEGVKNDPSV